MKALRWRMIGLLMLDSIISNLMRSTPGVTAILWTLDGERDAAAVS